MNNKNNFTTLNIVTCAMLSALAVILGSAVHHLSGGNTDVASFISPMHFPVLLAGILCGPWLGLICGAMAPLISFLTSGRPPFPNGLVPMLLELAAYGLLTGLFRRIFLKNPKLNRFASVIALVLAMIAGRLVNAITAGVFLAISGKYAYFMGVLFQLGRNFTATWGGIIAQILLIPAILFALQKGGILLKYLPDTPTSKSVNTAPIDETAETQVASTEGDTGAEEE